MSKLSSIVKNDGSAMITLSSGNFRIGQEANAFNPMYHFIDSNVGQFWLKFNIIPVANSIPLRLSAQM